MMEMIAESFAKSLVLLEHLSHGLRTLIRADIGELAEGHIT